MRAAREVLVVEVTRDGARAARVARDGDGARLASVATAQGQDPREAALAALEALGGSRRPPVAVVTREVSAACLEWPVPPGGLTDEQRRELVRWEIDPFVPGEGEVAAGHANVESRAPSGRARRLACGTRRSVVDAWMAALEAKGFDLVALHPAGTGALALLPVEKEGPSSAVVEVRADLLGCVRVEREAVASVRVREPEPGGEAPTARACLDLAGAGVGVVSFVGDQALVASLAAELDALGAPARRAIPGVDDPDLAPILGVARQALGLPGGERLASVQTRQAPPPLWKRAWARPVGAGLIVTLALLVGDLSLKSSISSMKAELARPTLPMDTARRPDRTAAIAQEKDSVASLDADLKALTARKKSLGDELGRDQAVRQHLLRLAASRSEAVSLIGAVARSANERAFVESLEEGVPGAWHVRGFALDEPAFQELTQSLSRELATSGFAPGDETVKAAKGPYGLEGCAFDLIIVAPALVSAKDAVVPTPATPASTSRTAWPKGRR